MAVGGGSSNSKAVLEISIVKDTTGVGISSALPTIEIPLNANINIYNEGGAPLLLYASDINWDITKKLDTKINEMDNAISQLGNIQMFKAINTNTNVVFTINQNIILLGIFIKLISGTPTIGISVNGENFIENYVLNSNKFDINLNTILVQNTNSVSCPVSGGYVNVYITYIKL